LRAKGKRIMPEDNSRKTAKRKRKNSRLIALVAAAFLLALAAFLSLLLSGEVDKLTYKLTNVAAIARYSEEYDVDPYLVAAIIYVESGHRETAVSPKGALGLMQIMPATAEWIAQKLGEPYDLNNVTEPYTNIRYGCWYLNFLFERFTPVDTVLAAYNAGHNAVRGWLNDPSYSDDGVTLKRIPYPETEHYVEKVDRAYEKYKKLYPKAFD
jgi:soluble lytic murein transglycosylase